MTDTLAAECKVGTLNPDRAEVVFDAAAYRLSAVKKAALKFGDRFHTLITIVTTQNTNSIKVVLRAKSVVDSFEFLVGEFCNEVLDQDLRERISEETEAVRNLILAHAFSRTSLINADWDSVDYHADPLGIAVPKAEHS